MRTFLLSFPFFVTPFPKKTYPTVKPLCRIETSKILTTHAFNNSADLRRQSIKAWQARVWGGQVLERDDATFACNEF